MRLIEETLHYYTTQTLESSLMFGGSFHQLMRAVRALNTRVKVLEVTHLTSRLHNDIILPVHTCLAFFYQINATHTFSAIS
jgi:hypothetical protein